MKIRFDPLWIKTDEQLAAVSALLCLLEEAREVKILMRLPDSRNVATGQAVHGSAPCVRTEVLSARRRS